METKKDLNNTQRKMLDEIYTEQFRIKEQRINEERQEAGRKLKAKVLAQEKNSKNIKALLAAGAKFLALVEEHKDELKSKGLKVTNLPYREEGKYELELADRYDTDKHPDVVAFNQETYDLQEKMAKVKKEMRARIYGMNTTYEEVEKDINEILKGVK